MRLPFLLLVLAALSTITNAGGNPKTASAVRTTQPPRVDGIPDEPIWQLARPLEGFVQLEPLEGAMPTQRTDVRFLYDDDYLYIGARMFDTHPDSIVARLARRDDEIHSDYLSVRIDTYHDHQTNCEFTLNASGVKVDVLQYDDGQREDISWDAVWDAETQIGPDGWSAEIRIPFSMLRFRDEDVQQWGLQVHRIIARNQERDHWVLIGKAESGTTSHFGHLDGIRGIHDGRSVEFLPYGLVSAAALSATPDGPARREMRVDGGVDVKYRPTSGITVDATFNPDFGQVEADPAVLNLSTFETFYPEKRPFFIEGTQIFRFTTFGDAFGPGLFYSRRIGRPLRLSPPAGGKVIEDPRYASIIGAAKISGKTASGLSLGVLEAVTAEETGLVEDAAGTRSRVVVEPLTNYSLLRLKQDLFSASNVGMILTSMNRKDRIPGVAGGIDWNLKFLQNMYRLDGFLAHTRTAMTGDLREGSAGKVGLTKSGGPHWRGSFTLDFTSKRYNVNDVGFFRRPNDHGVIAVAEYRDDIVNGTTRWWSTSAQWHRRWNFDRAELNHSLNLKGQVLLMNYWELVAEGAFDAGLFDDRETRGLGLFRKPSTSTLSLTWESDSREMVVAEVNLKGQKDSRQMTGIGVTAQVEVKPISTLTLQCALGYTMIERQFAWVSNGLIDPLIDPVGPRSTFADRSTRQWDLTSRGSFVFTRTLTLQTYFQLFVAKGRYQGVSQRLGVDTYRASSLTVPDFTDLSFNSNVVLRWEYRPGSTLFAVWSHARRGGFGPYARSVFDNVGDTFELAPDNVLLVKLSYWFTS